LKNETKKIVSRSFSKTINNPTARLDFKGTIVNRVFSSLHGGSLEITLTVPLDQIKNEADIHGFTFMILQDN